MNNRELINEVIKFKEQLRSEIEISLSADMKSTLWKVLITAEIAHRSFVLNISIEKFEENYFDRDAAVARYFRDWGMDWVADGYDLINKNVTKDYLPKKTE